MENNEKVLVIDFGSPYNQLLTRQIRSLGVYSELLPHTVTAEKVREMKPKAIILSGGPYYVEDDNRYRIDDKIYDLGIPMLGICYGMQLLTEQFGGKVEHQQARTYEPTTVQLQTTSSLFADMQETQSVMASGGDVIQNVPETFQVDATFEHGEVEATTHGMDILKNFLFSIIGCAGEWTIEGFIKSEIANIRAEVGDRKVLCALSGGVDSSVVAALIHRAIGDQLTCIFVDHGLL